MANNTNDSGLVIPAHPYVGEYIPESSRIAFIFVGTAMILSALVGNTTLIFIILKHFMRNKKKRLHDLFIANLALNDLITLCYWHLFFVLDLILGYYPVVNHPHCVTNGLICCMTFVVNIISLLSISFNRYLHVCHSHLYNRVFTLSRTICWCLLIWVFSLIHAIPPLWGGHAGNYHYNARAHICSYNRAGETYAKTLFMVYSLAPMLVIAYFNVAIFRFWRNARMSLTKRYPMAKKSEKRTARWRAALFSRNKKIIPGSLDAGTELDKKTIRNSDDEDAADSNNAAAERSDTSLTSTTEEKSSGWRSGEYNRYIMPKAERDGLMFRGLKAEFSSMSHSYSHTEDTETCTDTEDTTTLNSVEDKVFLDNFFKSNRGRSTRGKDAAASALHSTKSPTSLQRIALGNQLHKPSENSQQKRRKKSRSREVAFVRSLMVVCILMLIIFVPYTITVFMESPTTPPELAMFGICLLFSNNSINWIIYGLMNPSFKKSYVRYARRIFCACCRKRSRSRHTPECIIEDGRAVRADKHRDMNKLELPESVTDKHTDTDRNTTSRQTD